MRFRSRPSGGRGRSISPRILLASAAALLALALPAVPLAGASAACPNEVRRVEQHATYLPDCRGYELTTPGTTVDVIADTGRTVAAAAESPGLPMAVKFSSLVGFGEVEGSGIAFDYLGQRTGQPGTNGWTFRGITPRQEPLSYFAATNNVDPLYELFSPDLSKGIFRSYSSLPGTSDNAKEIPNLYLRQDLRAAGEGSYQPLTDSFAHQPPLPLFGAALHRPWPAGASADLQHVIFETTRNLTADASGNDVKLYKSDAGVVHLVAANGACPGGAAENAPCSKAGVGASNPGFNNPYTPRTISQDGSRVNFMSPFNPAGPNTQPGLVSKLYQFDDRGTSSTGDDAVIQLSKSEAAVPDPAKAAIYGTASSDGSHVFFTSSERLTEAPDSGLYMWERQEEDEEQGLTVDATGGTLTLTAHAQPSYGEGSLTENSTEVSGVSGSFTVGQTISAPGIPAGTTVTEVAPSGETILLSAEATETATQSLTASLRDTTDPLPWDATAVQVQSALEGLEFLGEGNVAVSGSGPYSIEFTGALAGVNEMQLTADASGLSGGGSSATIATTNDIHNLALIGPAATAVIGASADGHRLYFTRNDEIWYWEDADGVAGGTLFHVASLAEGDLKNQVLNYQDVGILQSRVTPDGRSLLFLASDGGALPPHYQHGMCVGNSLTGANNGLCTEIYLFRADTSTPGEPNIICASCDPSVPEGVGNSFPNVRTGFGASVTTKHLSRALTDDGRHVFFDAEGALVPEDTNGAVDVYDYDVEGGQIHLVSSGTDEAPSYFMDSSADGSDVFFLTRASLSGWDDDQAYDLYDARVGGGFPEPPAQAAPCDGDSCKGAAGAAPAAAQVGSAALGGVGNVKDRRHCPKDRRTVKRKGQVRCVKHHHKHHPRSAGKKRRAGR